MSYSFFSNSFIITAREDPKVAECDSQRLLLKGCYLFMLSSGIYSYLPLGLRVLEKINGIIRKHMNAAGAQELLMSALQPMEIWEKTGRDKVLEEVMFRFPDRKKRTLCLGPTHEEVITEIARKYAASYKQLPFILYQIQTKFRDEPRPRFGLVRSCEFIMKDAYSFDIDENGLEANYAKMRDAYRDIFTECGLRFVMIEADSGAMGGSVSHEFLVPAAIGEDILFYCEKCGSYYRQQQDCPQCKAAAKETKMLEMGHIFKLGTKYSSTLGALVLDNKGERRPMIMGCYGIGVSRLLPAIAEQNFDEKGIAWPAAVSPFDLTLVVLDAKLLPEAATLAETLSRDNSDILIDDRNENAGIKFNDSGLIGSPHTAIMGKNYLGSGKIEVEVRKTKEKISLSKEELVNFLKEKNQKHR